MATQRLPEQDLVDGFSEKSQQRAAELAGKRIGNRRAAGETRRRGILAERKAPVQTNTRCSQHRVSIVERGARAVRSPTHESVYRNTTFRYKRIF